MGSDFTWHTWRPGPLPHSPSIHFSLCLSLSLLLSLLLFCCHLNFNSRHTQRNTTQTQPEQPTSAPMAVPFYAHVFSWIYLCVIVSLFRINFNFNVFAHSYYLAITFSTSAKWFEYHISVWWNEFLLFLLQTSFVEPIFCCALLPLFNLIS